jgi:hypothetical protein
MDDAIVFSNGFEQPIDRLDEVLKRFESAGLKLNPDKCKLFVKEVKYLGFLISAEGLKPDK